jgi:hypothetical protein
MLGLAVGDSGVHQSRAGSAEIKRSMLGRTSTRWDACSSRCWSGIRRSIGRTKNEIIAKRFVERPPLVSTLREGVPPAVAAAVERALERDADKRFRIANDFALRTRRRCLPRFRTDACLSTEEARARPSMLSPCFHSRTCPGDQEAEYFADGMTDELINACRISPRCAFPLERRRLRTSARLKMCAASVRNSACRPFSREQSGARAIACALRLS